MAFEISGPFIESIMVLCNNREERQQWIDLLSQDQTSSSLLHSPLMSQVSFRSHSYSRLSRFYAKLVRKKIIYPELVKKLLYFQYVCKPDLTDVKIRKCKVTYTIYPRYSEDSEHGDVIGHRLKVPEEKQRLKLKSSLMLDVRYATKNEVGNYPCSLLAGASLSFRKLGASASNLSIFSNSQSLPGEFSSVVNLRHLLSRNAILPAIPFSRSNKISEQKTEGELSSIDDIHIVHCPSQLTTIPKNVGDLQETSGSLLLPVTSVHSSDSGMADSCHISLSELNCRYYPIGRSKCAEYAQMSHSESENDENKFEHQCICTSPFGSTPRQSQQRSQSRENFNNSFTIYTPMRDAIDEGAEDENIRYLMNADEKDDFKHCRINKCIDRVGEGDRDESASTAAYIVEKRSTAPIPLEHQNISTQLRKIHRRPNVIYVEEVQTVPVYRSGFYAHWWFKKTIHIDESTKQGKLPWHGCPSFPIVPYQLVFF